MNDLGFTIITSAYANDKDYRTKYHFAEVGRNLRKAIESVFSQNYENFEMLICSDGDNDNIRKTVESYKDPRIKYNFLEFSGEMGGCPAQNEMIKKAEKDLTMHLDQDNILYTDCLNRVSEEWGDDFGLLIFRIAHNKVGVIPKRDHIQHKDIDALNGVTRASISKRCRWENKAPSADSRFYMKVEQICNDEDHKIKFINDILGVHH